MSGFLDVQTLSQISVCEKMLFKLVDAPFFKNMCIKYWYMKQSVLCPNLLLQNFYVNALGMPDIDSPYTRCWLCIFSTKINKNNLPPDSCWGIRTAIFALRSFASKLSTTWVCVCVCPQMSLSSTRLQLVAVTLIILMVFYVIYFSNVNENLFKFSSATKLR